MRGQTLKNQRVGEKVQFLQLVATTSRLMRGSSVAELVLSRRNRTIVRGEIVHQSLAGPLTVAKLLTPVTCLNDEALAHGTRLLSRRDADLGRVVRKFGAPPMWARESGFSTLLHIILEQQVSLASAKAAHNKLLEVASPLTPRGFLKLDDVTLKAVGFSRQKTLYGRELARSILGGLLDIEALSAMDDATVRSELVKIKGIGRWTADIYLLMVLRRPDIWPVGDLALATAAQKIKGLKNRPDTKELDQLSAPWKPWRAVGARILWHYYLNELV